MIFRYVIAIMQYLPSVDTYIPVICSQIGHGVSFRTNSETLCLKIALYFMPYKHKVQRKNLRRWKGNKHPMW